MTRLGKKDYKYDPRTLLLGRAISDTVTIPSAYDFDHGRTPFPIKMWGNDRWGDCVKAGQTNQILRLERLETRHTPSVTDDQVVDAYKAETGAQEPGDEHDTGLVILENNRLWRTVGMQIGTKAYKIDAFGELDFHNHVQLRQAVYLLHGIQFGFALPLALQSNPTAWDCPASPSGENWTPGSWGGHCVYALGYDSLGMSILTWGKKVRVTWNFIDHYCDEGWAVVDSLDKWAKRPEIDTDAILAKLRQIGASGIETA